MTKIDIYSGFLGAGKTTLIKKMIAEGYAGQKLVLIENEFGEIGIDGGFLQEAGINITEMNSGCICCSLVGDFGKALEQVIQQYNPDRVLIEPSGVGKLSDVLAAAKKVTGEQVQLGYTVAVVDAGKVKIYSKNFGEFYNDQVQTASTIVLSRTASIAQAKLDAALEILRSINPDATIVTTPWEELTGAQLIEAMEGKSARAKELAHHHHHHHDGECCCGGGHHHHHDGECCHGEGHHHHHDGECCHGEGHHHHDGECCHGEGHHHHHDGECCHGEGHHHHHDGECGCGGHHHHHHADEVFTSWGVETAKKFTQEQIHQALSQLDTGKYGIVLRSKGIVACAEGGWIHFDYVPGEISIRMGAADITGKLCVIGSKLDEAGVAALFGV